MPVLTRLLLQLSVLNLLGAIRIMHLVKLCNVLRRLILQLGQQILYPLLVVIWFIYRLKFPLLEFLKLHCRLLQL